MGKRESEGIKMAKCEFIAELNLKKIISESREVAQALNEFADNLERIENKYEKPQESKIKEVRKGNTLSD